MMIIIISLAALMLAVTLTACIKPGRAENIVMYDYTNPIDELHDYYCSLEKENRK